MRSCRNLGRSFFLFAQPSDLTPEIVEDTMMPITSKKKHSIAAAAAMEEEEDDYANLIYKGRRLLHWRPTRRILMLHVELQLPSRKRTGFAAAIDAQIKLGKKEYACGMEQRKRNAAAKDARIILTKEECA